MSTGSDPRMIQEASHRAGSPNVHNLLKVTNPVYVAGIYARN